ncbi:MAG TPA: hypothetical protein VG889_14030 [Rhizomicrobium sp.]|nr:hypothetical protein [Rhizomicrobium sp.]
MSAAAFRATEIFAPLPCASTQTAWRTVAPGNAMADSDSIWGQAFIKIASGLSELPSFENWLAGKLANGRNTASPPASGEFKLPHVGHLVDGEPRASLGLLVGFFLPGTGMVRFAFPDSDRNYREWRTPFAKRALTEEQFPEHEILRHRLLQMTFSQERLEEPSEICRSMMKAALLSGKQLCCSDTRCLKEGDRHHAYRVSPGGIRFVSLNKAAEAVWGVRSVCYVPIAYPLGFGRSDAASIVLCFYCPFDAIFGKSPRYYSVFDTADFVEDFKKSVFDKFDYSVLVESDLQTRAAVKTAVGRSFDRVKEVLRRELLDEIPLIIARANWIPDGVIQEVTGTIKGALENSHLQALHLVARARNAEAEIAKKTVSPKGLARLKRVVQNEIKAIEARHDQAIPSVEFKIDEETERLCELEPASLAEAVEDTDPNEFEDLVACAVRAFLKNLAEHSAQPVTGSPAAAMIEFGKADGQSGMFEISVKNPAHFNRSLLESLWTAKEGIFPRREGSHPGGVQLFALKIACEDAPTLSKYLKIEYDVQVSDNQPSDIATWVSRVIFAGPGLKSVLKQRKKPR